MHRVFDTPDRRETRRRTRPLLIVIACFATLATAGHAQVGGVQAGQRVRITLTEQPRTVEGATLPQVLRGEVQRAVGDSVWLVIHPGLGPTSVSLGVIQQLDVSRGVEPWWEAAWRQGKKTALLLGLEAFVFRLFADGPFDSVWEAGIIGAGIGMTGGAIAGALRPQETWHPLPWPPERPASGAAGATPRPRS